MSARNSRWAKDARNRTMKADLARRQEARSSAVDLLEEKMRNEVRRIANEYNAKLEASSRGELVAEYVKRKKEGEALDLLLPRRTRQHLIEVLTLTVEDEDRIIDKEKKDGSR